MGGGSTGTRLPTAIGTVGGSGAGSASGWIRRVLRSYAPVGRIGGLGTNRAQYPPAAGRQVAAGSARPTAFDEVIRSAARREGLDEQLVKAVVEAESGFNPRAVSSAGAKGLMQLLDGTARALGVKDPFDPNANVAGGTRFLRSMLDRFGSVPLALAAYNAGPQAVEEHRGIPPYRETRNYVDRVLALHRRNQLEMLATPAEVDGNGERSAI